MNQQDHDLLQKIDLQLTVFDQQKRKLPGIADAANRRALLGQIFESMRRIRYISVMGKRKLSPLRSDPSSHLFDPLLAAILHQRQGNIDEACWLVFLSVHFGKHRNGGWRYVREIYGRLGEGVLWDWPHISEDPESFRKWLAAHYATLKRPGAGFGNHRKYQSLSASKPNGTAAALISYVKWINPPRTHKLFLAEAQTQGGSDPRKVFARLYHSMDCVISFGRTAKFDYLTMLGKIGLANIEPGSTFMDGATGPLSGARLLFGGGKDVALRRAELDGWLVELGTALGIGMQVVEDALCNWQKSPATFKPFRG